MATIVYLHGFASTGVGDKSTQLITNLADHTVLSPTLSTTPSVVINQIKSLVEQHRKSYPLIFVGTSIGGFWANYFAHLYDAIGVLVNPSVTPSKTMQERLGKQLFNYQTNEPIVITEQDIVEYEQCEKYVSEMYNGALIHLFVAEDDDVLDSKTTLDLLKYRKSCTITADGGHRYTSNWHLVINHIKTLVN